MRVPWGRICIFNFGVGIFPELREGDKSWNKVKYNLEVVYIVSNWEGIIEYRRINSITGRMLSTGLSGSHS